MRRRRSRRKRRSDKVSRRMRKLEGEKLSEWESGSTEEEEVTPETL
jgi:hypothetical protein